MSTAIDNPAHAAHTNPCAQPTTDTKPDDASSSTARTMRIALLGCGTVGASVAHQLLEHRESIERQLGRSIEVCSILIRNRAKRRTIRYDRWTNCFDEVCRSQPDVVIEMLGGCDPASRWIQQTLEQGVHVVTANKSVIARDGAMLRQVARQHESFLAYEAAVCASIPILAAVRQLEGDVVYSLTGILNGSTNYILSRMHDNGLSQREALAEAKERGLIEPDPKADLSGRDCVEKLAILASHLGYEEVHPDTIDLVGIESVMREDVLAARKLGFTLRLVAELRSTRDGCALRVGPTLVPREHALSRVSLEQNGVLINAALGGELFLSGAGAGPDPTTSAILSDLVRVLRQTRPADSAAPRSEASQRQQRTHSNAALLRVPRPHLIRIDRDASWSPRDLFESLRQNCISIRHVDMCANAARVLTHPATTAQVRHVVEEYPGGSTGGGSLIAPVVLNINCDDRTSGAGPAFPSVHAQKHVMSRRIA